MMCTHANYTRQHDEKTKTRAATLGCHCYNAIDLHRLARGAAAAPAARGCGRERGERVCGES